MSDETNMNDLTQEDVEEIFVEIKAAWTEMIEDSGLSEKMFIALNPDENAS